MWDESPWSQGDNMITPDTLTGDGQVVVQLAVDKSRSVCLSVAHGEVDVAIIGGHVPEDLKDVLQVCQSYLNPPLHCCSIGRAFQAACLKCRQSLGVHTQTMHSKRKALAGSFPTAQSSSRVECVTLRLESSTAVACACSMYLAAVRWCYSALHLIISTASSSHCPTCHAPMQVCL